jgi:hypothetical protein
VYAGTTRRQFSRSWAVISLLKCRLGTCWPILQSSPSLRLDALPWRRVLSLTLCDRRYGTRLTKDAEKNRIRITEAENRLHRMHDERSDLLWLDEDPSASSLDALSPVNQEHHNDHGTIDDLASRFGHLYNRKNRLEKSD